jgi:5-methylcytosine-specific restriction endonuclease McrA
MSRWLRLYDDTINDPKVLKLPEALRWHWIALLCIASKNGGALPGLDDIAIQLRVTTAKAIEILAKLTKSGLLDKTETGFAPHNWEGRQYISDSSAERVKRHRAKRSAAGLLSQWQPSKELRHEVYERDDYQCVYCQSPDDLTIDHKTPEHRGGSNDFENLQTLCRKCNASKRDLTHEEYIERNGDVTLLKRPQNTDNRKQNSVAIATGADAPVDPSIAERELFDRGKQILGKSAGGQIAKLKAAKGGNVALARSVIEAASTKQNPSEYVAAAIRAGPTFAKPLTAHQHKQQEMKDVLNELADFATGGSSGGEPNPRILRHDPGSGPQGIRGGVGSDVDDLPPRRH